MDYLSFLDQEFEKQDEVAREKAELDPEPQQN